MTRHEELVVARIRADHLRIPGQRRCALDGQRVPCKQLKVAEDIEAGRRTVDGTPVIEVVPWREVWRGIRWWLPWLILLAAAFGWPGPELLS